MTGRMSGRIEVVARVSGRRRWTVEQNLSILRDAFGPNGSVRDAVEQHEVGSGQLYTWRRQAMAGMLVGTTRPTVLVFAQVQIAAEPVVLLLPGPTVAEPAGRIGIELPSGIRLSVDALVDAEALARMITHIGKLADPPTEQKCRLAVRQNCRWAHRQPQPTQAIRRRHDRYGGIASPRPDRQEPASRH